MYRVRIQEKNIGEHEHDADMKDPKMDVLVLEAGEVHERWLPMSRIVPDPVECSSDVTGRRKLEAGMLCRHHSFRRRRQSKGLRLLRLRPEHVFCPRVSPSPERRTIPDFVLPLLLDLL